MGSAPDSRTKLPSSGKNQQVDNFHGPSGNRKHSCSPSCLLRALQLSIPPGLSTPPHVFPLRKGGINDKFKSRTSQGMFEAQALSQSAVFPEQALLRKACGIQPSLLLSVSEGQCQDPKWKPCCPKPALPLKRVVICLQLPDSWISQLIMNLGRKEGCHYLSGFLKTHPPICTLRQAPETSARSVA